VDAARTVTVDRPTLKPDQVLVEVEYAAIDTAVDAVLQKTMTGKFVHARTSPLVLGWHYSGKVAEVGSDAGETLKADDKVWGFLQYEPNQDQGSFSEFVAVGADECAVQPDGVDVAHLTAASTESITALQAMRDLGGLSSDDAKSKSVLVLGGGGGVGSVAVQIAKNLGAARVAAACSAKDMERVKGLGAEIALDRSKEDPLSGDKYALIFDTPAKYSATKAMRRLNRKGAYVVTLPTFRLYVAKFLSMYNGKRAKFVQCHSNRQDLELVGKWLKEGSLKVEVDTTYAIRDLERAVERQRSKTKLPGARVVVKVKGGW